MTQTIDEDEIPLCPGCGAPSVWDPVENKVELCRRCLAAQGEDIGEGDDDEP